MDDDAGRVEHAPQPRPPCLRELFAQPRVEVAGVGAGADLLARLLDHSARGVHGERVVRVSRELVDGREVPELHLPKV